MSRFQKLSVATAGMSVALVTVGGVVRATGSGLGCPDWPRCHGRLVPPLEAGAIIEYSHRMAASVVGALVLAMAIMAWVRFRRVPSIFWPAFGALVAVILQAALGKVVVERELQSHLVALHFSLALLLVGLTVLTAVASFLPRGGRIDRMAAGALFMAGGVFAVLLLGAFVVQAHASRVFTDWPLMAGGIAPGSGTLPEVVHHLHRVAALLLGGIIGFMALRVMRREPRDRALIRLAHTALAVWIAQVLIGGAVVISGIAPWAVITHVFSGAMLWATSVALAAVAYRRPTLVETSPTGPPQERPVRRAVRAYFLLTKPRIIELLLITTVPAMLVAARGWPSLWLIVATVLGGSLAAGAANVINCYLDRDIDERMDRTSGRPLPAHQVEPQKALLFGVVLGAVGAVWLAVLVNPLSAALALGAILFYVFVYTLGLKRSTPSNIVIGGAAGAVPVLVGWAAVKGSVGLPALVLFAIVFYWTPPHFWALALRYSEEYAAAGVPMLPVVRGVPETVRHILLYSFALVAVSLLLYPAGEMGVVYLASALILGGSFIVQAFRLHRNPDAPQAMSFFRFTITYLTLLFAAMAVDQLVRAPRIGNLDGLSYLGAATVFFAVQAALVLSVLGWRRGGEQVPDLGAVDARAEALWTVIPTVLVTVLFLATGSV